MESLSFLVIAVGILGFALVSGRVQRSVLTAPMLFVAFGYVVTRGLGARELSARLVGGTRVVEVV